MRLWAASTGACLREMRHAGAVYSIAALSHGVRDLLVSGCSDHGLRVWDAFGGELECELYGHADGVTALAVLRDASVTKLVSAAKDGALAVWAWQTVRGVQSATREWESRLAGGAILTLAALE